MRVGKAQQGEWERAWAALAVGNAALKAAYDELLAGLERLEQQFEAAAGARNALAAAAREVARRVADDLEDQWDGRSERWQEGEAGQAARDLVDQWRDLADGGLDDVDAVAVLEPDEPDLPTGMPPVEYESEG